MRATRDEEVRRRAVVDRDDDDADEQAAPEGDDPLGPVLAEDDDLVTLDDACRRPAGPRRRGAARADLARS